MSVRQAVTELPEAKPELVTAQIHDAESDVMEVRLEDKRDGPVRGRGEGVRPRPDYTLGTPYDLRLVATDGRIDVLYNGRPAGSIVQSGSGWYFKTGSYLQSNTEKGDAADAVGKVVLYRVRVIHAGETRRASARHRPCPGPRCVLRERLLHRHRRHAPTHSATRRCARFRAEPGARPGARPHQLEPHVAQRLAGQARHRAAARARHLFEPVLPGRRGARRGGVHIRRGGGVTTKGSSYPRSELRETNGGELAGVDQPPWHPHPRRVAEAVIARRPPVEARGRRARRSTTADDDVIQSPPRGQDRLIAQYGGGSGDKNEYGHRSRTYVLGTPDDLRLVAAAGRIDVFYNGAHSGGAALAGDNWYFKTGSYLQSNVSKGDAADAVGQVVLYALRVSHAG